MSILAQGLLLSRGIKTEQTRLPERREGSASMMLRLDTPLLLFTLTLLLLLLFRVTFDAHCLCCGVLEETHGLCLVATGHVHRSRLLCAGRGG